MADTYTVFLDALRRGFEATDGMQRLTREVEGLVEEMGVAAKSATDGRVYISATRDGHWRVDARSSSAKRVAELFLIVPSNAGYPVNVQFRQRSPGHECTNYIALRVALLGMCETPEVGENILRLMGDSK